MMRATSRILGYDPGGDGKHGVAVLDIGDEVPISLTTQTLQTAEAVIRFFGSLTNVRALGVDTLTCWSTGRGGWRPADRWLRKKYPQVGTSVVTPNGLFGSMGLNGPAVLLECQAAHPALLTTETHPKVLHWHLSRQRYDYAADHHRMRALLAELLQVNIETDSDHAWDAALSAFAAFKGTAGTWTLDLQGLPIEGSERIVWPCGRTHYYWPS